MSKLLVLKQAKTFKNRLCDQLNKLLKVDISSTCSLNQTNFRLYQKQWSFIDFLIDNKGVNLV